MKLADLLRIVGAHDVFETGLLLAGDVDPFDVRRQLSRWTRDGKVLQIRRGLYALAPLYAKGSPHPFVIANLLLRPSYVSTESALAHAGHIPEHVAAVTSVTTGRPGVHDTPLGRFIYRHIKREGFFGHRRIEVVPGQEAFIASPEKALADLVYLRAGADHRDFLRELRLQGQERLDVDLLRAAAERLHSPKIARVARFLDQLIREGRDEYVDV